MSIESHGHEHEFEPQYGLPERLPKDERILWQGSPDFGAMARRVFHIRKVAFYFSFLLLAHVVNLLWSGSGVAQILLSLRWILPLAFLGIGAVTMLAWLTAKTTVYTLTDKRIVMRVGIVLTVTFNLPLKRLASAGLLLHKKGFGEAANQDATATKASTDHYGDINLVLSGQDRIAWAQLWPSVRPWRFTKPEPTLRAVAHAQLVSDQLTAAWLAVKNQEAGESGSQSAKPVAQTEASPHSVTAPLSASGNSQPHTSKWQAQTT